MLCPVMLIRPLLSLPKECCCNFMMLHLILLSFISARSANVIRYTYLDVPVSLLCTQYIQGGFNYYANACYIYNTDKPQRRYQCLIQAQHEIVEQSRVTPNITTSLLGQYTGQHNSTCSTLHITVLHNLGSCNCKNITRCAVLWPHYMRRSEVVQTTAKLNFYYSVSKIASAHINGRSVHPSITPFSSQAHSRTQRPAKSFSLHTV